MVQLATSPSETVVLPPREIVCVDLEGALLRTRVSDERFLGLLRQSPGCLRQLPAWWRQGRAAAELGARTRLGYDVLPLDEDCLAWLHAKLARGAELVLLASLGQEAAEAIAARLGIFTSVRGNLAGAHKRAFAEQTFGPEILYVGREAMGESTEAAPRPPSGWRAALKALRLHQWAKNALIFVPPALAGPFATTLDWAQAGLAFLVFGLIASAGYLVNDLLDLDADRRHRTKRFRPFAAGDLSIRAGAVAIGLLTLTAGALCLLLPAPVALVAGAYFAITLAYSLWLKLEPFLDVILLATLFTLRVLAGGLLLSKPFSYWLLAFALFFFLGLATAKRVVELKAVGGVANLRGYSERDLALLIPLGIGCVVAANVIFVTYLIAEHFPGTTYANPEWLWLILPILLYWPLRLWRSVMHGHMDDDPVLFALRDRVSLALGGSVLLLLALAW